MLSSIKYSDTFEIKKEVQRALSDSCCRQILSSITKKAKTVSEISADLGFSKSRIYRKIHILEKTNLVRVSGDISKDGCKCFRYLSRMHHFIHPTHLEKEDYSAKTISNEVKFNGT